MKQSASRTDGRKRSPWRTLLIVMLSIAGVLVLVFGALVALYSYEYSRPVCWKSGEVIIDGQTVTLPCAVDDFVQQLDAQLTDNASSDVTKETAVEGERGTIRFRVFLSQDGTEVKGISVNADSIGDRDGIVFPGGVTLDSDIEAVNELYATRPLNIYHSHWSEEIVFSDDVSAGYRYVDHSSFQINVDTLNGEVNEIFYCYIADE